MDRPEEAVTEPEEVATLAAQGKRISRQALVASLVSTVALYVVAVLST